MNNQEERLNQIIKFRGISLATGKWLYGYVYRWNGNSYIFEDNYFSGDEYISDAFDELEVIPKTVSQFIIDKNKIEIYDGDILRWKCSATNRIKKGVIYFDENRLTYWCKDQTLASLFYTQTNEHYLASNRFTYYCPVVIGNKFLNPELMEKINEQPRIN